MATVIDRATRMVTGWQLASHMRTSLVTDALTMAITHGHVQPGAVSHSDRGTQGGHGEDRVPRSVPRKPAVHQVVS